MTRHNACIKPGAHRHLDDGERPGEIMRAYTAALAPGSVVVFTHFCTPADGSPSDHLAGEIEHCFRTSSMGTSRFRTREDLRSFLHGLELLPTSAAPDAPTIVPVRDWWPCGPPTRPREPMDELFVAAIGRKPDSLMPQTNCRNEDR